MPKKETVHDAMLGNLSTSTQLCDSMICAIGRTSSRPLDPMPEGSILDPDGLFLHLFNLGMKQGEAIKTVNGARKIRSWLQRDDGLRASLMHDEENACKFILTLKTDVWSKGELMTKAGKYNVTISQGA